MKVRRDYVTNSSSSSFILAIRKDATKEKLIEILSNPEYKYLFSDDYSIEELIDDMMDVDGNLMNGTFITINGWKIYGGSTSNDDYQSNLMQSLYYSKLIDSEYLKLCNEEMK